MGTLVSMLPLILMLGLFYLIIFIPENKRKKKYATMLSGLAVNSEVVTKGGIMGKIVNIQDDFIILETGPDKMRIKLSKSGVLNVVNSTIEEKK